MNSADFDTFVMLLRERSGLSITTDKIYLLETRLLPVAHRHGLGDLGALGQALRQNPGGGLADEIVEAMTTNETLFFRDRKPFDALQERLLPQLAERRKVMKKIRIWSAACSTGQEPYSLAMLIAEQSSRYAGYQFEILGTDISPAALKKAEQGEYNQFEIQRGLPAPYLIKYFEKCGDNWVVCPAIRQMVSFRPFNLLHDPTQFGRFDIIFCRNVLIYFDVATKGKVVDRLGNRLAADGYLSLGCAESLLGINSRFKPLEGLHGIYTQAASAAGAGEAGDGPASPFAPPGGGGKPLAPRVLSR